MTIRLHENAYRAVSDALDARARAAPPPPPDPEELHCPQCGERAPPARASAFGWVKSTDGRWWSSKDCLVRAARAAPSQGQPIPLLDTTAPAFVSSTWSGVPLPGAGQRRELRVTCAADPRHSMLVDQQRQPDGVNWGPDVPRLLAAAGWLERHGQRFCSAACLGTAPRSPAAPLVAVTEVNDQAYQRGRAALAPPPTAVARELVGREVPERGATTKRAR